MIDTCSSKDCLFGGALRTGEDVTVVWEIRGMYPIVLSDAVSDIIAFRGCKLYHTDCIMSKEWQERNKEEPKLHEWEEKHE